MTAKTDRNSKDGLKKVSQFRLTYICVQPGTYIQQPLNLKPKLLRFSRQDIEVPLYNKRTSTCLSESIWIRILLPNGGNMIFSKFLSSVV